MRLLMSLFLIACYSSSVIAQQAPSSMAIYSAPKDLQATLKPTGKTVGNQVELMSTVKSLVGNLKHVELSFSASPDLAQPSTTSHTQQIVEGKPLEILVTTTRNPGQRDLRSWVEMRVSYLPDYDALMKRVADDTKTYSHPQGRAELLAVLARMKEKQERIVLPVRLLLHNFKKGKK